MTSIAGAVQQRKTPPAQCADGVIRFYIRLGLAVEINFFNDFKRSCPQLGQIHQVN